MDFEKFAFLDDTWEMLDSYLFDYVLNNNMKNTVIRSPVGCLYIKI